MRPLRFVLVAFVVASLAGCGSGGAAPSPTSAAPPSPTVSSDSPSASPAQSTTAEPTTAPPTARPTPAPAPAGDVSVTRSGGLAGITQRVTVAQDGRWTYTSERGTQRSTKTGKLSAADRTKLRALVTSPKLMSEPGGGGADPCPDAYRYALKVGSDLRMWSACGGTPPPTATAVVGLLADATPL